MILKINLINGGIINSTSLFFDKFIDKHKCE